ncbi:putative transcription regulator SWI/SNF-BAF60b family [Helianthus annuus]|uniref:Transcription regulator SWI/SNF-BAF60b family n=2 Tax=Helianthus annuus TaxID=4232 RepID=A0A9K3I5T3_HELAN|nr:SWI/SNF complex component SNF12 homolog [Helianthus annuus]XP_021982431.1 SWI/SNF complex component SNF12 homolog [Helianthus annuus]KAF5790843.1 putative transcription regulator SWI/SNF-BAF60b family [Helianthus annuus]KAJ0526010.1 putative transcription regulator SWI/SNF-BAF60b family [Helianthus annuus]KAJ0534300.1 putative transcription regulator SWI/SNF-BAF60b family [Helianthus annuus]KAJ0542404.1 putative transcription regulator SWI/SNF-BAF60b family [Helianthus annuus]KAJ0707445.1 
MSMNNNTPQKNSPFGNSMTTNPSSHLQSQSQPQQQSGSPFASQFQLSQYAAAHAHAQAIAQAQSKAQAQAMAQAQANHAQFQAQLQAQGMSLNQSHGHFSGNSPSFPGLANSGIKRMPQKPVGRPPGVSNANTISPMRMMELTPAQRNKKKQKLPEKQLLERVAKILPQSALYTELLEFESRVDAALARKKIDIQDAIKNPPCIQKTLRIYVFNTFANQTRVSPMKPNDEPPTWTMKIIGRILEDDMHPDQAATLSTMYPKFSSFFKRVTISLDQRLYPDNHMIVWDSARSPTPQEGFEVKRKGDKEFTANIRLEMNYMPEKYKLSLALMEVLGIEVDTRARIIAAIWHYVKARKLQNADDPSYFNCDPALRKVFGEDKVKFAMVSQKISPHLSAPQPIHLEHKIKLSGNSPVGNACYDVLVDVPFPVQRELNALLAATEKAKEIEACDEAICTSIRKINEHRKRRAFFLGFSQSPVEFIDALIESQGRDLKLAAGEASRNAEKEARAEFYNQPWVEDAVIRYLNRKPANTGVHGST